MKRFFLALAALAMLVGPAFPRAAQGAAVSTDCAGLQVALSNAAPGDVITLTEMCVGQSFSLPNTPITLEGSRGAGFDGTGARDRVLSGASAASLTLRNLIFQNSHSANDGGAVALVGQSQVTVANCSFLGNSVDPSRYGGALAVTGEGGVVTISDSVFLNNAASHGGAASVRMLTNGGMLSVLQERNRFEGNSAEIGGGEFVQDADVTIHSDRFTNNRAGGLVVAFGRVVFPTFRGENLIVAGNLEGGISLIDESLGAPRLILSNSTVTGGISAVGGRAMHLSIQNSIVTTSGNPEITLRGISSDGGLPSLEAAYSDACAEQQGQILPYPGEGNICADPLLGPGPENAYFRETPTSPTVDRGSNDLVPPGLDSDYEGEVRIQDGDGDGTATVDMGADESKQAPSCGSATPSTWMISPPNQKLVPVDILNVSDPNGGRVGIMITGIRQDEPVGKVGAKNTGGCPDGSGVGTDTALLRAAKTGSNAYGGDGRIYHVRFQAANDAGGACGGEVMVCVPSGGGNQASCGDQGPLYDSTVCR